MDEGCTNLYNTARKFYIGDVITVVIQGAVNGGAERLARIQQSNLVLMQIFMTIGTNILLIRKQMNP